VYETNSGLTGLKVEFEPRMPPIPEWVGPLPAKLQSTTGMKQLKDQKTSARFRAHLKLNKGMFPSLEKQKPLNAPWRHTVHHALEDRDRLQGAIGAKHATVAKAAFPSRAVARPRVPVRPARPSRWKGRAVRGVPRPRRSAALVVLARSPLSPSRALAIRRRKGTLGCR
jgi:hypothetical protein